MSSATQHAVVAYDIYDPFQYPWMCLNFFLAFWFVSNASRSVMHLIKYSNIALTFSELAEEKKRNVVTYILQFWVTLVAFILQLYGGVDVLFRLADTTTPARNNAMLLAVLLIAVLYIWELCYRQTIGFPLLVHHIVTLILIQCSTASYFDTQNVFYLRYSMLLGFHATTEQISFLALFYFRLSISPKYQSALFYAATLQAFVLKTLVTFASFIFFIMDAYAGDALDDDPTRWDMFWKIMFLPLIVALYGSQLYACKILYALAKRSKTTYEKMNKLVEDAEKAPNARERVSCLQQGIRSSISEHQSSVDVLDSFENASRHHRSSSLSFGTTSGHPQRYSHFARSSHHSSPGTSPIIHGAKTSPQTVRRRSKKPPASKDSAEDLPEFMPPPPTKLAVIQSGQYYSPSEELYAQRDSLFDSVLSFGGADPTEEVHRHMNTINRVSRPSFAAEEDPQRRSELLREAVIACITAAESPSSPYGPWDIADDENEEAALGNGDHEEEEAAGKSPAKTEEDAPPPRSTSTATIATTPPPDEEDGSGVFDA
jgi:hypothetical protein